MVQESDVFLEGAQTLQQEWTPTMPNLIASLNIKALSADEAKLAAFNAEHPGLTKVFIIGMPSDIGVRAHDGRAGAERGPESFRELLSLCAMPSNPVSTDIQLLSTIKIYDCGNIEVD